MKYKVTMVSVGVTGLDSDGQVVLTRHEAVDYVPQEDLSAYVEDAKTRWQIVQVDENPVEGK